MLAKKSAFFQPFSRFFLAFSIFLGYSSGRPEFFTEKQGVARLGACFDRIGV